MKWQNWGSESSGSEPSVISVTAHGSHAFPRRCWPESSILWALYLLTGIREATTAPGPVPWFGKWVRPLSWGQSLSEATPWQGWRKAGMGKTEEEGEVARAHPSFSSICCQSWEAPCALAMPLPGLEEAR